MCNWVNILIMNDLGEIISILFLTMSKKTMQLIKIL
jgi:hypothetical protein